MGSIATTATRVSESKHAYSDPPRTRTETDTEIRAVVGDSYDPDQALNVVKMFAGTAVSSGTRVPLRNRLSRLNHTMVAGLSTELTSRRTPADSVTVSYKMEELRLLIEREATTDPRSPWITFFGSARRG
jgi:hypothetical protein